ncbi:MAG: AMP-binding protein [Chloroflexaceae bacterium]|nr:AMP-binding protein [Chloroflexaceae bacterium]
MGMVGQLRDFGLGRGDRIALVMGNSPELVQCFFAAATCGTVAPLNPKYTVDDFAFYYGDTHARALITLPDTVPAAHEAAPDAMQIIHALPQPDGSVRLEQVRGNLPPRAAEPISADDIAMILHTSGTTSRPKRVPLRHRNMVASARNIAGTYNLSPDDMALCVMPLFHVHGLMGSMMATLASGGALVVPSGFSAMEFWKWMRTFSPTWYSAVPTMHQLLLQRAERNQETIAAHPFRFIRSSSAPLPPVVLERIESTFNAPLLESYGMTEATHQMASNPLPPAARKAGSVGYGFGVDVAIMDETSSTLLPQGATGEVVVRGPNVIDGYEQNPEANAKSFVDGWFRTGDQGHIDADGYLILTGRLKELINRGGEKISPFEIDNLLLRHPAVEQALAFAVPHKMLGEEINAAVVLKPGSDISEADLRDYCAENLAPFKVPRAFHMLEEIPRGATGKLQRLAMARLLNLSE